MKYVFPRLLGCTAFLYLLISMFSGLNTLLWSGLAVGFFMVAQAVTAIGILIHYLTFVRK